MVHGITDPNQDVEPLKQWTDYQLDVARRASFTDLENGFSARSTLTSGVAGVSPLSTEAHDYDEPVRSHLEPFSIHMDGLHWIGGIDISYRNDGDGKDAVAALVVFRYPSMKQTHTVLRQVRVTHPYVPEYLAMRELSAVLETYDEAMRSLPVNERPQVILVDGHGRWHERQAGLATAFGVERDIPTIGVAKEYHPLRPDMAAYMRHDPLPIPAPPWPQTEHFRVHQKTFRTVARRLLSTRGDFLGIPYYKGGPLVGAALVGAGLPPSNRDTTGCRNPSPCYVSPGHRVSLETSIALALVCCGSFTSKLPIPIVLADRLGRDEVKRLWSVSR